MSLDGVEKTRMLQRHWSQHTWGVVGSLVTVLSQMFSWFRQWNRSIFDEVNTYEVKAYKESVPVFLGHLVYRLHPW